MLSGPVKSRQGQDVVVLESAASVRAPAVMAFIGLQFIFLQWVFRIPGYIPLACGLICFLISAELLIRPRIIVSSQSKSVQILAWSWLHFHRALEEEIPYADVQEILVEPEFELGIGDDPNVWHAVLLCKGSHRADVAWHFEKQSTMMVAEQLSHMLRKPVRVENDATQSGRWAFWGYNFLR